MVSMSVFDVEYGGHITEAAVGTAMVGIKETPLVGPFEDGATEGTGVNVDVGAGVGTLVLSPLPSLPENVTSKTPEHCWFA